MMDFEVNLSNSDFVVTIDDAFAKLWQREELQKFKDTEFYKELITRNNNDITIPMDY